MPPFIPRKRARESEPAQQSTSTKKARSAALSRGRKPTVFDAVDQQIHKPKSGVEQRQRLLDTLHTSDDDKSSLSDADSDEFVDVHPSNKEKLSSGHGVARASGSKSDDGEEDEDEEDDMNWEDAIPEPKSSSGPATTLQTSTSTHEIGDITISIKDDGTYVEPTVTTGVAKKGPSKRERQMRTNSHCLHVQSLMWHNTIRNSWINDKRVQDSLLRALPEGVQREFIRWKHAMGKLSREELAANKKEAMRKSAAKVGRRAKKKGSSGRDWNPEADHLEHGVPDLSHGDPLFRLLKVLAAYWRKRFTITAPGLRKRGYMDLRRLQSEVRGWQQNGADFETYGECIRNLEEFRDLAERCEGSRDVGAQLFVALLRGLGLETRLVASLQPLGFGWSKGEDATAQRTKRASSAVEVVSSATPKSSKQSKANGTPQSTSRSTVPSEVRTPRRNTAGAKHDPIDIEATDSSLSSVPESIGSDSATDDDNDDASIIEILPTPTKKRPTKKYDRDLAFPIYWAEVCSPATNKVIPVDAMVLSTIGSNDELAQSFEPRGKKAELAKQVICYTVAHNTDGTAKDVTIRYLKRHQLPGKTKGVRLPSEKIAIHNRKGKVLRYEEHDWFKALMLLYERSKDKYTAFDVVEEETDLKPFQMASQKQDVEKESLQWYKQSAEFVLEQHLRREEALRPGAESVKTFSAGKGDKSKEYAVYRRADVVACKTVESWHKEGRALLKGQHPMKLVPMRAVTLVRKREMEDAQRETGERLKQGLYSREQTEWIIPPPIQDGIIPKNAFGNMDVYVPTMVPEGAVHLPLKGSARICRKLEIDFAEACTGFEFGKQRAVPVLTGVVVARENERMVRDAWKIDQAERKRKEDTKRTAHSLHWWRKMLLGLRVVERMRIEYQGIDLEEAEINPFVAKAQRQARKGHVDGLVDPESAGGGFVLPSDDEERASLSNGDLDPDNHDNMSTTMDVSTNGGGFLVEDNLSDASDHHKPIRTPQSLQSVNSIKQFEHKVPESLHGSTTSAHDQDSELGVSPRRANIKATPKRSQYFAPKSKQVKKGRKRTSREETDPPSPESGSSQELSDNGAESESMSEEEIVRPRRTTARTRSSRA